MVSQTAELPVNVSPKEHHINPIETVLVQPSITADQARRRANGYLTKHVSMYFGATDALFLPLERPIWQVSVVFLRNHLGPVHLAFLDVDANTGEVIPMTDQEIHQLRQRAHAYVTNHTLSTAS